MRPPSVGCEVDFVSDHTSTELEPLLLVEGTDQV